MKDWTIKPSTRYRVKTPLRFAEFTVPKDALFKTPAVLPAWMSPLLIGIVPLRIRGRIRIVAAHEVQRLVTKRTSRRKKPK